MELDPKQRQKEIEDLSCLLKMSLLPDNHIQNKLFKVISLNRQKITLATHCDILLEDLLSIFTSEATEPIVKQIAGLTLKGYMETNIQNLSGGVTLSKLITGLKQNLTNQIEPRITCVVISTVIRLSTEESWKEILLFLIENLDNRRNLASTLLLLLYIFEDACMDKVYNKFSEFNSPIIKSLMEIVSQSDDLKLIEESLRIMDLVLEHFNSDFKEYPDFLFNVYNKVSHITKSEIKILLSKISLNLIKKNPGFLLENHFFFINMILNNYFIKDLNYELNYVASKILLFMLENIEIMQNESIFNTIKSNLNK